jgi:hypothetical protein
MGQPSMLQVGVLYSSDEIQTLLGVGNAGGIRVSVGDGGNVTRAALLTSVPTARQLSENPYHDRVEGDTLVYTGTGRQGAQLLAGVNKRLPQQLDRDFPIYCFELIGSRRDSSIGPKRWRFVGLLEYLRHYPGQQIDKTGTLRQVWLFEFRIHTDPATIDIQHDHIVSTNLLQASRLQNANEDADRELATHAQEPEEQTHDPRLVESVRRAMLADTPGAFEHFVKDLLEATGFCNVAVTQYSQDGGIDVNAHVSDRMWPIADLMLQVQAKRWLHTVGRREVAQLRGSLEPFARGALVTTSHYSRAALLEAASPGRSPIVLIDGQALASIAIRLGFADRITGKAV